MSGDSPRPVLPASADVFDRALESLMGFWAGDYEGAAAEGPALNIDPSTGQDPIYAAMSDVEHLTPSFVDPIRALLCEAALACARVHDAVEFIEQAGPPPEEIFGGPHPFVTFVWVLRTRIASAH